MDLKKLKVAELAQDPANVRTHGEKNLEAIRGSLKRFGQQKPIVVDGNGVVIAGNGTLMAAQSLGWNDIWAVESGLRGAEQTAYGIADNRASELAAWDMEKLIQQLNALESDPVTTGFAAQNDFDFLLRQISSVGYGAEDFTDTAFGGETAGDEGEPAGESERAAKLILLFDSQADYDVFVAKMETFARQRGIDGGQRVIMTAALDELIGLGRGEEE